MVCWSCGILLSPFIDLDKKATRMRHFSQFFMDNYYVENTGKGIVVNLINIEKGIIRYDFGPGTFSLAHFLIGLAHYVIGGIIYLMTYSQHAYWKARFNELGFITDIRNNQNLTQRDVLEAYMLVNPEYRKFLEKQPKAIIKKGAWSTKSSGERIGLWVLYFFLFMIIVTALFYFIAFLTEQFS